MLKGTLNGRTASLVVKRDAPHDAIPRDGISPRIRLTPGQPYSYAVGIELTERIPGGLTSENRTTAWLVNPDLVILDKDVTATPIGTAYRLVRVSDGATIADFRG